MRLIALLLCSIPAFGAHIQSGNLAPVGGTGINGGLMGNPTQGDVVIGKVYTYNNNSASTPTITCIDGNGNAYTVTTAQGGTTYNGFIAFFYLLNVPSNGSATINCTSSLATGGFAAGWIDEFSYTGTAALDGSVVTSTGTGTSVVLPSITVTGTNDVLYSGITNPSGGLTVNSPWTQNAYPSQYASSWAEYLITSSTTTVNWTIGSSQPWTASGIAIKFTTPNPYSTTLTPGNTLTQGNTIR